MSIVNKSATDLIEYNKSLELQNQELRSTIASQELVIADLKAKLSESQKETLRLIECLSNCTGILRGLKFQLTGVPILIDPINDALQESRQTIDAAIAQTKAKECGK